MGVLRDVDADLSRTIIGHIERTLLERTDMRKLAETGCVLEFDLFGREHSYYKHSPDIDMINDAVRLKLLAWLIAEGYGRQLVLAHDPAQVAPRPLRRVRLCPHPAEHRAPDALARVQGSGHPDDADGDAEAAWPSRRHEIRSSCQGDEAEPHPTLPSCAGTFIRSERQVTSALLGRRRRWPARCRAASCGVVAGRRPR